jgi:hypothetical protein
MSVGQQERSPYLLILGRNFKTTLFMGVVISGKEKEDRARVS